MVDGDGRARRGASGRLALPGAPGGDAPPPTIDVIGRFEVVIGGESRTIVGGLQRRLLSLLILRSPRWTSPDVLSEALWPESSTSGPGSRLHLQVHRMREKVGQGTIQSGPDGYRLIVPEDAVDVWRFESAVGEVLADHFRGRGDTELLERLEHAVRLWAGTPFPEVEHADVDAERHRLQEMYLLAQETRFAHLLDRGEHETALDLIAPVAGEHVTRESLQAQWMTALHRVGRRSEAVEAFEAAREALAALGLSPGRELLAARAGVLEQPSARQESDLAGTVAARDMDEGVLRRELASASTPEEMLRARRRLARSLAMKGELDEALELLGQIEAVLRADSREDEVANALGDLAAVIGVTGDLSRAEHYLDEALELEERTTGTDARLRLVRALLLTHSGRAEQAARILHEVPRPPRATASVPATERATMWWRVRSQVDRRRGDTEAAVAAARRAVWLGSLPGTRVDRGPVLVDLASSLRDDGDDECFAWFHRAIDAAYEDGRRPMAAFAHAAMAKAQLMWGEPEVARLHAREALSIARRCGCWGFAARAAKRAADAAMALSDPMRAAWYYSEALSFYRRVGYPLLPEVRAELVERVASGA
ncbi:AfsR/SARP family transcriptional regulator [Brachybacterium alimentarium]|uniref:AfsR/SARP family transcriptional regulator n=1 Tax=Brachybacterium alimentarium TaxID=47845 RepID=UPI0031DFAA02